MTVGGSLKTPKQFPLRKGMRMDGGQGHDMELKGRKENGLGHFALDAELRIAVYYYGYIST